LIYSFHVLRKGIPGQIPGTLQLARTYPDLPLLSSNGARVRSLRFAGPRAC
jgi:hypothetical protein